MTPAQVPAKDSSTRLGLLQNNMPRHLCLPLLALLLLQLQPALCVYNCSSDYDRTPDSSDLTVDCGTRTIILEINLCTAQWAGFNTTNLALNGNHNTSACLGTVDSNVSPPVIRYELPVNDSVANPCRQSMQILDETPAAGGVFSSFSTVQAVVINGFIDTPTSDEGLISYSTDLYYHFSCRYPLEYLINNTQIVASSVSVATSDNNGSFADTLQMAVFNGSDFNYPLVVPTEGIQLRTNIYVQVEAVNLTGSFHILMDHCFATPSPYNLAQTEQHNFFTGCSVTPRTVVTANGVSTVSQFNFETFRFTQHGDQAKSTMYLHCILRLCEPTKCQELLAGCGNRRKRSATPFGEESSDSATVSVGPLYIAKEEANPHSASQSSDGVPEKDTGDMTGLAVGVVFGSAAAVALVMAGWFALKKFYWAGGLPHAFH